MTTIVADCFKCQTKEAAAFLEILPGRTLCVDCSIQSNEGFVVETGVSVPCSICTEMTGAGEEIDGVHMYP